MNITSHHQEPSGFCIKRFPEIAILHAWAEGAETVTRLTNPQIQKIIAALQTPGLIFTTANATVRKNYSTNLSA